MADKTRAQILGENLERIRKEKGVTRKELAESIDVALDSIGGYAIGKRLAPLDKIFALANFFNISIIDLTGDTQFGEIRKNLQHRLSRAEGMAASAGFSMARLDDGGVTLTSPAKIRENTDGTFTSVVEYCYTFKDANEFINFAEMVESQMKYYMSDKDSFLSKPTFENLIKQKFKKHRK